MLTFLVSIAIGVGVGVLSGMLGIGGGMVMVPVFRVGYLMAAIEATATSLFAIVPTSIAGCVTHVRNKTCIPALGIATGIGGACTSWIGVQLANISPSWLIMLVAATVIAYSAYTMFKKARALPKDGEAPKPVPAPAPEASAAPDAAATAPAPEAAGVLPLGEGGRLSARTALIGAAIGMLAGVASGYVGVGGGFIMVPMFVALLGIGMKKASGTSLIAVSILAVPGVIAQLILGNVYVAAGAAMAIGGIPGAVLGANLAKRVPERKLRFLFGGMLVFAAISLLAKEVGF